MYRVVIFGGTTEGRVLYSYCVEKNIPAIVYVATEYGEQVLDRSHEQLQTVHEGRLRFEEMLGMLEREKPVLVLDATHPYAYQVTENIQKCCQLLGLSYFRIVREEKRLTEDHAKEQEKLFFFDTIKEAVSFLEQKQGNIFVTTGSKELWQYTALSDYKNRLYVRILPDVEAVKNCIGLGIEGRHLSAMQGPFSEEMNYGFLKEYDIRWMVTKQSGVQGGFYEKKAAARRAEASLLIIRKKGRESGISLEEAMRILEGVK